MDLLKELLQQSNGVSEYKKPKAAEYFELVYNQARQHALRRGKNDRIDVTDDLRPNEVESTKQFRIKNTRQITRAGVNLFHSKSSRIIRQCVSSENESEAIKSYIETKPFKFNGVTMSKSEWIYDVVYMKSLISPNDLLIAFPYNPFNQLVPPNSPEEEGGIPENMEVPIMPMILKWDDRLTETGVAFEGGEMKVIGSTKKNHTHKFYFEADETNWYLVYPKQQGKTVTLEKAIWYVHDTGESLYNPLAGIDSCNFDGDCVFRESYLSGYYEFADLALAAHSDDVIVRKRFSFPLVAMKRTKCTVCDGKGKTGVGDKRKTCDGCRGKKYTYLPGPNGLLLKNSDSEHFKTKDGDDKLVEFFNPDIAYAKNSIEVPEYFLQKAYRAAGLELLDAAGKSMSAEALRELKEDFVDILGKAAMGLFDVVDRFFWHVECLRVDNKEDRKKYVTAIPQKIEIKDEFTLKELAENALPEDRLHAKNIYYKQKYINQPEMARYYEILTCYSPYIDMDLEELRTRIAKGVCKDEDIIKRDYAAIALKEIMNDPEIDFSELSNKDAFELLDQWFIDKDLISVVQQVEIFNPSPETEPLEEELNEQ